MSVHRKSFNIFEKINTIKKTCAAIEDDINPDDISWTSSNHDEQKCVKSKRLISESVMDPREKVKNWIQNNSNIKKRVTNSKSASKKCKNRKMTNCKSVSKLNVCEVMLCKDNDEKSESLSPIISTTQMERINIEKIEKKSKEVSILCTPVKINLEHNYYESHSGGTHSPVLGKKRKLVFESENMLPVESENEILFESEEMLPMENSSREASPILCGQFHKKIICQKNSFTPTKTDKNCNENENCNSETCFQPKKYLKDIFENKTNANNENDNGNTKHQNFPPKKFLSSIFENESMNNCNENGNIKTKFPSKQCMNAIVENELSQVSIKFSNSPILDIAALKSQQSSELCAKICYASSEMKEDINESNSFGIVSLSTTPPKSTQTILSADKNVELTFDASRMNNDGFDSTVKKKRKKLIRGGVASRLQKALKKQNSLLSHWRHQIYLAANTNFELPAIKEFYIFKICNVLEEYGRFLIKCFKIESLMETADCYSLLLNNYFVKKLTLQIGGTVRLCQPFSLFKIKNCKNEFEYFICNVCNIEILS